jgi:hypothetical protein
MASLGGQRDKLILILMIIDKHARFIFCFFHILLISYYASFIFCSFHFNIDVLTCSCSFYYRMSQKISCLARSFLKKSKDGNKEGLFQGSSSSSSRHEALIRTVQADFPRRGVAFMNEVI